LGDGKSRQTPPLGWRVQDKALLIEIRYYPRERSMCFMPVDGSCCTERVGETRDQVVLNEGKERGRMTGDVEVVVGACLVALIIPGAFC
jgi:hypothetical protein